MTRERRDEIMVWAQTQTIWPSGSSIAPSPREIRELLGYIGVLEDALEDRGERVEVVAQERDPRAAVAEGPIEMQSYHLRMVQRSGGSNVELLMRSTGVRICELERADLREFGEFLIRCADRCGK